MEKIDVGTFIRSSQSLFDFFANREGKVAIWLRLFVMAPLLAFQQDLRYLMQAIQVLIFYVAQNDILFIIVGIFVFTGWKSL